MYIHKKHKKQSIVTIL